METAPTDAAAGGGAEIAFATLATDTAVAGALFVAFAAAHIVEVAGAALDEGNSTETARAAHSRQLAGESLVARLIDFLLTANACAICRTTTFQ